MELNELISQTYTEYQAEQAAAAEQARTAKREAERQAEATMMTRLKEALSKEFLSGVTLAFKHSYDSTYGNRHSVTAIVTYLGHEWYLDYDESHAGWKISVGPHVRHPKYANGVTASSLQLALLVDMGEHREAEQKAAIKRAENKQREEASQRQFEEDERKHEEARQTRHAQARAEDARLRALFAVKRAEAEKQLWVWPENVTIEIYQLTYCKGYGQTDDDGVGEFDYVSHWTAVSHLDAQDRIQIEAQTFNSSTDHLTPTRVMQLIPEFHRPIFEVFRISSVMELPAKLRQEKRVFFPHVYEEAANYETCDTVHLVELEKDKGYYIEEGCYNESIGWEPLPWIQQLVETQVKTSI